MTYLPSQESTGLAAGAGFDAPEMSLGARIDRVDGRLDKVDLHLDAIIHRLGGMVLALVAGLVAIIVTKVAQSFI